MECVRLQSVVFVFSLFANQFQQASVGRTA